MQSPTREARPLSVVDYDAWNRGYMPPSEHVLIDQLAYRGARVVMSSDWGSYGAVWVVVRGDKIMRPEFRKSLRELLGLAMEYDLPNPQPSQVENWG